VWGGTPAEKAWAINDAKVDTGTADVWYHDQTDGATPTIGTYTVGGGDAPAAEVAAG